ncbi:hypothetical protein CL689_01390 [Candidatus Saccharibacteria bacterium]|nr:hypothetical protein [Candidatus Saccharibacteria bacterium]MBJ58392.1 hypothetical protein [Candidatus Saccharibacteria bacterium]MBQ68704.1 hypothetical protein [Candidatus Saccharibacteria bacterium]|tara:strand:+ start:81 stop:299 length:219 start_codon:yes stop_codon:yes gene_type:complete
MSTVTATARDLMEGTEIDVTMPETLTVADILNASGVTIEDRAVMVKGRTVTDVSTSVDAGEKVLLVPRPANG